MKQISGTNAYRMNEARGRDFEITAQGHASFPKGFPIVFEERGWHSRLVRDLGASGPEFDFRISHPRFDFFPFCVA